MNLTQAGEAGLSSSGSEYLQRIQILLLLSKNIWRWTWISVRFPKLLISFELIFGIIYIFLHCINSSKYTLPPTPTSLHEIWEYYFFPLEDTSLTLMTFGMFLYVCFYVCMYTMYVLRIPLTWREYLTTIGLHGISLQTGHRAAPRFHFWFLPQFVWYRKLKLLVW